MVPCPGNWPYPTGMLGSHPGKDSVSLTSTTDQRNEWQSEKPVPASRVRRVQERDLTSNLCLGGRQGETSSPGLYVMLPLIWELGIMWEWGFGSWARGGAGRGRRRWWRQRRWLLSSLEDVIFWRISGFLMCFQPPVPWSLEINRKSLPTPQKVQSFTSKLNQQ